MSCFSLTAELLNYSFNFDLKMFESLFVTLV